MHDVVTTARAEPAVTALSQLIATLMRERRLTLRQVAEDGGLSIASVAALRSSERGKRPRPDTLVRLARGLGVSISVVESAAHPVGGGPAGRLLELFNQMPADAQRQLLRTAEDLVSRARLPAPRTP